ncbi:TetR/AcrR family transcriptional regulator [Streptomonospora sediminis]
MQAQAPHSRAGAPLRTGRPRNAQIDAAVTGATFDVLNESGYSGLTMESVARRAGTTKPAIYRRWPTRQHLVLAALAERLGQVEAPDTECTLCDISECISLFACVFDRMPPDVLGPLLADCAGDPELRAAFMSALFDPPRAAVDQTLSRALQRGDLRADTDRRLILDLLGSLVHYRVLFGHAPITGEEVDTAVQTLLQGVAADYPALLAHALQQENDAQSHHRHGGGEG